MSVLPRRCRRLRAMGMLLASALLATGSTASTARAQDEEAAKAIKDGACCHEPEPVLAPLPEDASPKLRRLRELFDASQNAESFFTGERLLAKLERDVADAERTGDPLRTYGRRFALGLQQLRTGRVAQAIEQLDRCVALCDDGGAGPKLPPSLRIDALYYLGVAHFRRAEVENCIANHNEESCILPLSARAAHVAPRGAQGAYAVFERLLKEPENHRAAESAWLLNVVAMALKQWPDGVPEQWRYPRESFRPEQPAARFTEVAKRMGLDRRGRTGSIVADDLDGDGDEDVVMSSFDPGTPLALFVNNGFGLFEDVADESGLAGQLGGSHLTRADFDGDGKLDLFVARGGGLTFEGAFPPSLLLQRDELRFEDVTAAAGLEIEAPASTSCAADVDQDGDLDLFVGCESAGQPDGSLRWPSRLHRNDGAARFTDVTRAAGIDLAAGCSGAVLADFDDDGRPDLFVAHPLAASRMFTNASSADRIAFVDATARSGIDGPQFSGAVCCADVDQDGDLDLFVAAKNHISVEAGVARFYRDGAVTSDPSRLFLNDGSGKFRDATTERRMNRVAQTLAAGFADFDQDGFDDLYLGTGGHEMSSLFPNVLLRNDRGSFFDVTFAAGVGHLQKSAALAFADLDDDGAPEILIRTGGMYPDDRFAAVVFQEPTPAAHRLAVDLRGAGANRFAVGARITAHVEEDGKPRDVHAWVGVDGSHSASSLRRTLGLGAANRIVSVDVRWPGRGADGQPIVTTLRDVPLDAAIVVTQGTDGFATRKSRAR